MTALWTTHHEELWRDDGVSPEVCAPRVVPKCWVVPDWCNPGGSAEDTGLDAAARVRRAARAVWWRCCARSV